MYNFNQINAASDWPCLFTLGVLFSISLLVTKLSYSELAEHIASYIASYRIAGKFGRGKSSEFGESSAIRQTKTIQIY